MKEVRSGIVFTDITVAHGCTPLFGEVEVDFLATSLLESSPIAGTLKSAIGCLDKLDLNKKYELIIREAE